MQIFAGTLTREGGAGILRLTLDARGFHVEETLFLTDPNYLIEAGGRLYAVSSDAQGERTGCVNELSAAGRLLVRARMPAGGDGPCFLCAAPDGRFLYCANYGSGSIASFPLEGGLGARLELVSHTGAGPHPTRQTGPHVHQVIFIPGTQYLCACDLGTDEIVVYRADRETGRLTRHGAVCLHGGPRHMCCGREGLAYLCHELSSEVTVLRVREGALSPVQTLSTLPETVANTASAIRLSADGKRLYVSNRGHGSIAVFDVDAGGLLRAAGHIPAGAYPRDFVLLDDGRMLIADQRAGLRLLDEQGHERAFLPHIGVVCVLAMA